MELVAMVEFDVFHSVQPPHEVEVPIAAAEFSIGDDLESSFLLFGDEGCDASVLNRFEFLSCDVAILEGGSCHFDCMRTKKTPYDVSAKRRID